MLSYLLIVFSLSLPDSVEQVVSLEAARDSIQAVQAVMLPFRKEIEAAAREHDLPASLVAAVIQEESRFEQWAARTEPHYKRRSIVRSGARAHSKRWRGMPSIDTELDDRSRSIGLMQVMGQVAREQGYAEQYLSSMHLPVNALRQGCKHLKMLLARYRGDTLSAISAYNQGNNRKQNGVFANARYVYRVTLAWQVYRRLLK